MSETSEAMERMTAAIAEVQIAIADRFTPIVRATAHRLHSEWVFPMWPWYRRWWHIVRGCEWDTSRESHRESHAIAGNAIESGE